MSSRSDLFAKRLAQIFLVQAGALSSKEVNSKNLKYEKSVDEQIVSSLKVKAKKGGRRGK